jgi:chemotaxis protein histidine kinase CheA
MSNNSEFKQLFLKSSKKNISIVLDCLSKMKANSSDKNAIEGAYIAAHSLKGEADLMEIDNIGKTAKSLEASLKPVYKGKSSLKLEQLNNLISLADKLSQQVAEYQKEK